MSDAKGEKLGRGQAFLKRARNADSRRLRGLVPKIEEILAPGAPESEHVPSRVRARLIAYLDTAAFDRSRSLEGLATSTAAATLQLDEIFSRTLRFDVARSLIEMYLTRWPDSRPLSTKKPFLVDLDGPADEFRDDESCDIQIVRKPGATTTLVVFTGIRHAFGVHLNLFHHACLAGVPANIVYLRDFSLSNYLIGIRSLGGVEETRRALLTVFSDLKTERLVTIGNSGGVFGALYYGDLLDADEVIGFSGPTSLDIGMEHEERQVYARLSELRDQGKIAWPDFRLIYAARSTPVSMYFGGNNRFDRAQAEYLQDLPKVALFPFPTGHHFIVDDLVASGEFLAVLANAVAPRSRR